MNRLNPTYRSNLYFHECYMHTGYVYLIFFKPLKNWTQLDQIDPFSRCDWTLQKRYWIGFELIFCLGDTPPCTLQAGTIFCTWPCMINATLNFGIVDASWLFYFLPGVIFGEDTVLEIIDRPTRKWRAWKIWEGDAKLFMFHVAMHFRIQ